MNKKLIKDYILKYENSFSKESIKKQLLKSNTLESDINQVYSELYNSQNTKIKMTKKQKILIFVASLFLFIICTGLIIMFSFMASIMLTRPNIYYFIISIISFLIGTILSFILYKISKNIKISFIITFIVSLIISLLTLLSLLYIKIKMNEIKESCTITSCPIMSINIYLSLILILLFFNIIILTFFIFKKKIKN